MSVVLDLIHFEWLYHFKKNVIDSIDCNLKTMLETQESKDRCSKFSVTFIKHLLFGLEIGQWFSLIHLLSSYQFCLLTTMPNSVMLHKVK